MSKLVSLPSCNVPPAHLTVLLFYTDTNWIPLLGYDLPHPPFWIDRHVNSIYISSMVNGDPKFFCKF